MPVLVLADHSEGKFKNTALELISYGKSIAKMANTKLIVATIRATDVSAVNGREDRRHVRQEEQR